VRARGNARQNVLEGWKKEGKAIFELEDVRAVLAQMNSGRAPMPRDLVWTMENAPPKPGLPITAIALRKCLLRFRMHMHKQGGIVALITKYNKKGDGHLSDHDLRMVMEASGWVAR
jgi:hypothetical protein